VGGREVCTMRKTERYLFFTNTNSRLYEQKLANKEVNYSRTDYEQPLVFLTLLSVARQRARARARNRGKKIKARSRALAACNLFQTCRDVSS